jgi:hypothetical protein
VIDDKALTNDREPLRVAGRPLARHLRGRAPALTRRIVERLLAELPVYAELPAEEVAGDIAGIVQHNLRLLADVLERRGPAGDDALARQRDSAAQRAEEGVPLDAVLTAYQVGTALCWEEITTGAEPDDLADIQEALTHVFFLQRQLTSAVSGAYLEARRLLDSQEHIGRHTLTAALLAGESPEGFVHGTGFRPAALYVVLTLALPRHPDERDPGPRAGIAARRKIHRVRSALDRFAGQPALTTLDSRGGTALLPADAPPSWERLRQLIAAGAESAGVAITAAAARAEPAGIPAAVARTTEIVELVRRTGRPPGLYRLADVLLDYQLSRPSDALDGLAQLLAPLEGRPEFLSTLETYLRHGLDRRATAATLHVHPNTVDYRIRRITSLTGLSPARPEDLQHLHAALLARRAAPPAD